MKNALLLGSILGLGLTACGDNIASLRPDAREQTDAGPVIDSPPGTPDSNTTPDATVSTVTVVAGECPGTEDHLLRAVTGMNWEFDGGADTQDLDITIAAGENIEFDTTGQHNFASVADTGAMSFRSGNSVGGGHTACLTFTAPSGGPVDFNCETHPGIMTGTITVTP